MNRKRIALIVSHPIQHFCPQYASFAKNENVVFKVFFASAIGLQKYYDPNFKKEISWDNLYLDEFDHVFLNGEKMLRADRHLDAPTLTKALDEFAPDFVITYGYVQKLQRRAYRWAVKNKIQLGYISDSEMRHRTNAMKEWVKYFVIRSYFSKVNYFLSVGNANEEYYQRHGVKGRQLVRMHFPVDLRRYQVAYEQRSALREKIRNALQIGENELVLCVVGKLVRWKNQDHIIDALKLLEAEGVVAHLLMIGSGEMMEVWRQKATTLTRSKVIFTGFVAAEYLPGYYAAADVYVHPASLEPHSIAVSEAIYMGCPVILSDRCGSYGQTDDVQEGKNGHVFEFGNLKMLAEKIRGMLDANLRRSYGEYAHRISVQFQHRAHYEVLNEINQKLIA